MAEILWEQTFEAVKAFVKAETWAESKQIVETHRDLLLTDAADATMAYFLSEFSGDEELTGMLEDRRMILLRCRHEGIDAAFADYLRLESSTLNAQEDRDQLAEAIDAFINMRTWAEGKQIVETYRDLLLTDAADAILAHLLSTNRNDEFATHLLQQRRIVLLRCRHEGIDAAFADYL